ncbi:MAG: formate acetyltransferase, partial [Ruminococcus bromii]|nr:formate acetyltransferase [Ruminococcus bromii]
MNAWRSFTPGKWQEKIDVRDFIQKNYTPYTGDESFLQPPTERTKKMLEKYEALCRAEHENNGVLKIDTDTVITTTSFGPGYLDKENEIIVGLQTDEPLKRACNPFGGMRMVRASCEAYGYKVSDTIENQFKYHKTHNDGVFSA